MEQYGKPWHHGTGAVFCDQNRYFKILKIRAILLNFDYFSL
jgi:hypothetical protein